MRTSCTIPTKPITRQSHDRLATIAQNTALGSGFDVAMKDLELRGTGDLLGDQRERPYRRRRLRPVRAYRVRSGRTVQGAGTQGIGCRHHRPADRGVHSRRLHRFGQTAIGSVPETRLRTHRRRSRRAARGADRSLWQAACVFRCAVRRGARCEFKARKLGVSARSSRQDATVRASGVSSRRNPCACAWRRIYRGIPVPAGRPSTLIVPAPFAGSLGAKPMSSGDQMVRMGQPIARRPGTGNRHQRQRQWDAKKSVSVHTESCRAKFGIRP